MRDVWPLVHAERAALIDDLAELTDDQWAQPSLCGGWTVHDVAAHLIDNAKTTRLGIVRAMFRARFDFDRQNAQGVERERGATPRETLERLRQVAARTSTPPAPLDSKRGLLRQAGAVYQFRHARLRDHLTNQHRTKPRTTPPPEETTRSEDLRPLPEPP